VASHTVTRDIETRSTPTLFPFLDLRAQFEQIRPELMQAITDTFETQRFILGPEVEALEKEIAAYVGCGYAVACASGSDALLLALMALAIGPGDEVITTPFTFVATAGSIARAGATPIFVDIDPDTYNIDPAKLAAAIGPKTRAVIPVHLYGHPADMDPIMDLAQRNRLSVIEDTAQALGAEYHGVKVGSIGTIGCFSFFPSKNLGGAGDGGIMTTDDVELADRLRLLRVHGSRQKYHSEILGVNSRLDALQAAILRVKLRYLEVWTTRRRDNAARYFSLFKKYKLHTHVILPAEAQGCRHVFNQFVVRMLTRDEVRQHLSRTGIPTEVYYPEPLHVQPAFSYLGHKLGEFPHAEAASRQVLALPIFPELTESQQEMVVDGIAGYYLER
jgi:dTDP-4-amino-4,6-dideoxygalactose transaminase